jgi:hypothetical protein
VSTCIIICFFLFWLFCEIYADGKGPVLRDLCEYLCYYMIFFVVVM